jgi:hypothetical protein
VKRALIAKGVASNSGVDHSSLRRMEETMEPASDGDGEDLYATMDEEDEAS